MISHTSVKAVFMELLTAKFGGYAFWKTVECDLAMFCADLPEPGNNISVKIFIDQLEQIKTYLLAQGISDKEVEFIDEEINQYNNTTNISLYEEEEDAIDPDVVNTYARMGSESEGVLGIHQTFNYSQISKLSNGVFQKTGLIKFYISREKTLYGKIIAEIYDHPQKIPIASLVESKAKHKETGDPKFRGIKLFGERILPTEILVREIPIPFYVYRFITEDNIDMILLSNEPCEIGDYVITGVIKQCNDNKTLTESTKLPTKLPFFFAQIVRNRIIQYKNHNEFFVRAHHLRINNKMFYNYPFTVSVPNKKTKEIQQYKLLHPEWYKKLIWSWLLHQPKGMFNNYPMHLMVLGPMHSGKSLILNNLHEHSKESRRIFSGSSSTMKSLVPSFKHRPAQIGYLAESNRFAFCDEFLRCIVNTKSTSRDSEREESVAMMNDLLEHQKREAGSGISRINVNMTARIIAVSNPVRGIQNTTDLVNTLDGSFLSRWLVYYQTQDHVSMVRNSEDSKLEKYNFKISTNDWVSMLDYMHSFSATYDMAKVKEIYDSFAELLNENLAKHYSARHMHHIECLIDGIVKTRCLIKNDKSFVANDQDYDDLKQVWGSIITSWISFADINKLDVKDRVRYLPEKCQTLYWHIVNMRRPISKDEAKIIGLRIMKKSDYYDSWGILTDKELIVEKDGFAKPFFMVDDK